MVGGAIRLRGGAMDCVGGTSDDQTVYMGGAILCRSGLIFMGGANGVGGAALDGRAD